MPSFNNCTLVGNLTRDPELRYTPKGTAVVTVGLAVNRQWKDESGADKEDVCFIDVKAFGRRAESIAQYLKKGQPALFAGRLHQETWEDKNDGNRKRSKHVIIADECQFLGGGQRSEAAAESKGLTASEYEAVKANQESQDVPF